MRVIRRLSITARISLLFTLAVSLVLLVAGVFLVRAVEAHFVESDHHELQRKLALVRNLLARVDGPAALDGMTRKLDDALVVHHSLSVLILNPAGEAVFATLRADFPPALLARAACGGRDGLRCLTGPLRQWQRHGADYRGLVQTLPDATGARYQIAVALDIRHHSVFMADFIALLGGVMVLLVLATALLGWSATRRGLAPLRRVAELAAGISAERLAARLPEADLPRELRPLAASFNAMLARLDDAFQRLTAFSSDIAHELRTPISNLMTQTQVALSSTRGNQEYREVLYSSLEEYERMAQMVEDMLYLAKTDNGLLKPGQEAVDLAGEAADLLEFFGPWAEEQGVSLGLSGTAAVQGDRLMLRRALSNLVANAVRHTRAGGEVTIEMAAEGAMVAIRVTNPGPEIPAEHLPRLFDRFYRIDPARQRKGEGAGLGLAIVKSIADAHAGGIEVVSVQGRTTFTLRLPGAERM